MTILDKLLIHPILTEFPTSTLEFSKYIYKERGVTMRREFIYLNFKDMDKEYIKKFPLNEEEELALDSRVKIGNDDFHLPLIDFKVGKEYFDDVIEVCEKIKSYLEELNKPEDIEYSLFDSGHSFHGYFNTLISQNDWYDFLGYLILQYGNNSSISEIIDVRWIGHSLRAGFCALRLSKNTAHYKKEPQELVY